MRKDGIMKALLLITVCFACVLAVETHADHPDDVYWEPFSPPGWELNGYVNAMTVYDDKVIVGGNFTKVGTLTVNHIAAWDGASWSSLGSGTNSIVNALEVFDGKLYAGGGFDSAGGVPVDYIASWDGSSWSPLMPGIGSVVALTVFDGELVVGSQWYNSQTGESEGYVHSWNGTSWSILGHFEEWQWGNAFIYALAVYNDQLIVGGFFTHPTDMIAAWNGSSWSPVGGGLGSHVFSLGLYENKLVVGSWGISAWDGSSWSYFGSGIDDGLPVFAIDVYNSNLIAAGDFEMAGGDSVQCIASWDGSSWSSLGSGASYGVRDLLIHKNKLVVGGTFSIAGDKVSPYLAWWTKGSPTAVAFTSFQASAAENGITLSWSLSTNEFLEGFRIYRASVDDAIEDALNDRLIPPDERSYIDETAMPGERYRYTLVVISAESGEVRSETIEAELAPLTVQLYQNFPNPFNPTTSIRYIVPHTSHVTLRIYAPSGHLIRTLVDGKKSFGAHEATWDGMDNAGRPAASGIYVYRLQVGKVTQSKKMTLLK